MVRRILRKRVFADTDGSLPVRRCHPVQLHRLIQQRVDVTNDALVVRVQLVDGHDGWELLPHLGGAGRWLALCFAMLLSNGRGQLWTRAGLIWRMCHALCLGLFLKLDICLFVRRWLILALTLTLDVDLWLYFWLGVGLGLGWRGIRVCSLFGENIGEGLVGLVKVHRLNRDGSAVRVRMRRLLMPRKNRNWCMDGSVGVGDGKVRVGLSRCVLLLDVVCEDVLFEDGIAVRRWERIDRVPTLLVRMRAVQIVTWLDDPGRQISRSLVDIALAPVWVLLWQLLWMRRRIVMVTAATVPCEFHQAGCARCAGA
mmetsp:Transcript_22751/g.63489  ORF Transcript_22751/g.63489 Transcript_22751/m.63489 type:complete len:312 (-) Transcript_22751:112-1047(-)